MQEKKQAQDTVTVWGIEPIALETALYNAFIRHAIDNRGVLTSPRRGRQVASQISSLVQQYLAFEANESDITAAATQLAEQGMAMVTATQMMRVLHRSEPNLPDTAVTRRLNDFQILFLEKIANAREIVQQRFQETAQAALQRALHTQLEQQAGYGTPVEQSAASPEDYKGHRSSPGLQLPAMGILVSPWIRLS